MLNNKVFKINVVTVNSYIFLVKRYSFKISLSINGFIFNW